jgi:hypothetical protein
MNTTSLFPTDRPERGRLWTAGMTCVLALVRMVIGPALLALDGDSNSWLWDLFRAYTAIAGENVR